MSFLIFIIPLCFYLLNMAPSFTVGDAGELIASTKILGINHAPGYPLFSLLGKIFLTIIPFGDIAYKINLMSAFWGAATVLLVYLSLKKLAESTDSHKLSVSDEKFNCGAAALLFAVSFSFVRSSIQTEVFTLNSFFAALIIYLCIGQPTEKLSFKRWRLIAFIFGIGMGNHHTLILLAPAVFYLFVTQKPYRPTFSLFLSFSLLFMIGFSVYFYLPIRSVKNPGFDVGNPETMERVLRVIRRADYGTLRLTVGEKQAYSPEVVAKQFLRIFTGMIHQFTAVGLLFVLAGAYHIFKTNRRTAVFLLLAYAFSVPFFIFLGNIPFDAESEGILDRFYVMGNIPLIFLVFFGVGKNIRPIAFSAIILLLVVMNGRSYNWRNYFIAHDYGKNLFKSLEPNSAFFMDGGDDTFYSTGYFSFAKGLRPDVALFDRGGVVFKSPYGDDFRKLTREEKENRRKFVESSFSKIRPVYFSTFNKEIISPERVFPAGILYHRGDKKNLFHFYSTRNLYEDFNDYRTRALQPLYHYLEAQFSSNPIEYYLYCAARWPDVLWLKSNVKLALSHLAYKLFSEGKIGEAQNTYTALLNVFPEDATSWTNLGVIYERKGDEKNAINCYERAMAADPKYAMSYYNAAVIYWKKSDWEKVSFYFRKVLEYDPQNEQAKRYLAAAESKRIK